METQNNPFRKASRKNVKLKMAITGPSGAGKTYSALKLAKGLGGKICLIDTENKSADLYSHVADYDVCSLSQPYTTKRFIDLITKAVEFGYETIIVDSISHQWSGESGILERKTIKDSIGGSSFSNWRDFTVEQNKFISCIINTEANIICTMRSKTEYVLQENEKGKMAPKKIGLAPIQREGFDYEMSIVFDIAQNHMASVSKDRTSIFDGRNFVIDEKIGEEIKNFINSGEPIKKSLKDTILEKASGLKDEELKAKIVDLVTRENDNEKLEKYDKRVNELIKKENV